MAHPHPNLDLKPIIQSFFKEKDSDRRKKKKKERMIIMTIIMTQTPSQTIIKNKK